MVNLIGRKKGKVEAVFNVTKKTKMSSSTDSLKKKVCVTVFLDELFEEVEEEEWREPIQVSEVTESVAKVAEKPFKEPSRIDLGNDERINVSPNADTEPSKVQVRPRKHRRESKFSKNRYDLFKTELSKYGYSSCVKVENESREQVDSTVSDSDFDLDEFLGLDKWTFEKSRSSFTELSECDMTEESFLSIPPVLSFITTTKPKKAEKCPEKSDAYVEYTVLYCNKSTQFGTSDYECENTKVPCKKKEKASETEEEASSWKKTQKQIQLVLAETKSSHREKEASEGDRIRYYDLRSILEDCVKTGGSVPAHFEPSRLNASTDYNELDVQEPSDSCTCVFPHIKGSLQSRPPEVKRVWTSKGRGLWNDGLECDLSETDCTNYTKDIGLGSIQNDSLLCYTLCLKCKGSAEELEQSGNRSRSGVTRREPSMENVRPKASRDPSLVFHAVAHLADGAILGSILNAEQDKSEGDLPGGTSGSSPMVEGRSKNFAEGDTIAKPSGGDSKFILDLDTKEKLFVCDEILKHVGEARIIHSEIIVNRAEIELDPQDEVQEDAEALNPSPQTATTSEVIAEVFFNQKQSENLEKNMTDVESEMVFAESENFCDSEDFCSKFSVGPAPSLTFPKNHFQKDICVLEFEDKLSRSKVLRRMKTVEILGDNSMNDMKSISTEVILVCENISNNEVCFEVWQSSASTLKSVTEMKQCYLKDSRDSAMYLIEIPLHFTHPKKAKLPDSD